MAAIGWKRLTFPAIILVVVVAVGLYYPAIHGQVVKPSPAPSGTEDPLDRAAVVDLDRLVKAHPDARRLEQIDNEINVLAQRINPDVADRDRVAEGLFKQLQAMQKQLVAEFEGEVTRVRVQMNSRKASVEAQLKAEADQLKSEMEAFQKTVMPSSGASPSAPSVPAGRGKDVEARLKSYLSDLKLVRDRNLAARRLAVQKQAEQSLADERRQLEDRLNKKMDSVVREHQNEKLQLQLDLQTATDEDQRKKLQDRLTALTREEDEKRAALRQEMGASYEAARNREMGKAKAELESYAQKLDADVRKQWAAEQRRLMGYAPSSNPGSTTPANEVRAKLEAKQRELKARFEARKNSLMAQLQAESQAAQNLLRAKQKQVQEKLEQERRRILKIASRESEKLSDEEKKRRTRLQGELDALRAQRERVYNQIVDQIRDGVAVLAREEKVPFVFSGYRVNVRCQDMTEAVLQKVLKK